MICIILHAVQYMRSRPSYSSIYNPKQVYHAADMMNGKHSNASLIKQFLTPS